MNRRYSRAFRKDARVILRDEMMIHFLNKKPTSLEEFYKAVPMELRQKTDSKQLQYLQEIFELVAEYV
jgi:hypothetical protein